MQLSASQTERFYNIWFPLLRFVNKRRKLLNESFLGESWNPEHADMLRNELWANDALLNEFIEENPAALSSTDLAVVQSWRWRVQNTFVVVKHLKKYSVFAAESKDSDNRKYYGVYGLNSPIEDCMLIEAPCMVKAVLIPFEGRITYDSLFSSFPVHFGRNVSSRWNREYQEAKKREAIIESLEKPLLALV